MKLDFGVYFKSLTGEFNFGSTRLRLIAPAYTSSILIRFLKKWSSWKKYYNKRFGGPPKMLISHHNTTFRHNPEDHDFNLHSSENLKSRNLSYNEEYTLVEFYKNICICICIN